MVTGNRYWGTLLASPATLAVILAGCAPSRAPAPPNDGMAGATVEAAAAATTPVAERIPDAWAFPLDVEPVTASGGMVVSDAALATEVGADVLEDGGNAIDAAVATALALAVVYPEAGNLGGGGFIVARSADGRNYALDFREKAPLASTRDMYLNENGEQTRESIIGHLAAGVPGSVMGLWTAHQRLGSLPWERLVRPAIELAENGFTVSERFAATVAGREEELARFAGSAELFLPGGEPIEAGSTWRNPDLAATLRRIAEHGAAGFYEGRTADLIVAEMRRGGGLITHEDLARYDAVWREPILFDYRDQRVVAMPPVSSGGITLAIMANILEGYDLGELGWHSPRAVHLVAEAMRRAFADRNYYLGDPDFSDIPREMLTSEAYAAELRASIQPRHATPSAAVSHSAGGDGRPSMHTTHVSVVDAEGNAVALTTTVNFLYGSKVTVTGAGFVLNNEMNDFTAKPGEPNAYGLVQGVVNAIEPGKRMLSSMSPIIMLDRSGEPLLVTGARGGPKIITAVFQVMSNIVDYGMGVADAVRAPRVHHQHLPEVLEYEPNGLPADVVRTLEGWGYTVDSDGYLGHAPAILQVDEGWAGIPDPRDGGLAVGVGLAGVSSAIDDPLDSHRLVQADNHARAAGQYRVHIRRAQRDRGSGRRADGRAH